MSKLAFLLLVVSLQALTSAKYLSCPLGWVTYKESSYCYRVGNTPTNKRNEARKACLSMGGDLVKIRSAQENSYVALLARTYTSRNSGQIWMGLVGDINNVFTWVDGSPLAGQYSNWNSGEPNNYKGRNEVSFGAIILGSMKWNDEDPVARATMFYVCEREKAY